MLLGPGRKSHAHHPTTAAERLFPNALCGQLNLGATMMQPEEETPVHNAARQNASPA